MVGTLICEVQQAARTLALTQAGTSSVFHPAARPKCRAKDPLCVCGRSTSWGKAKRTKPVQGGRLHKRGSAQA
jgi:hypothetical protein